MPLCSAVRRFALFSACLFAFNFIPASPAQIPEQAVISRHAPAMNGAGRVEGSAQVLLGESFVLNGGATITGDLLVPGTPSVQINGTPSFGGVIEGTGSSIPSNYTITLDTASALRYLRTRTNATPIPPVAVPLASPGSRSVILNSATDSPGDWTTVRDLTVQGQAGIVSVNPGLSITHNFSAVE